MPPTPDRWNRQYPCGQATRQGRAGGRLTGTAGLPAEAATRKRHRSGMVGVPFDALAMTRQLKAKGFDPDQAEAITDAVRAGVTGGVATRASIAELRTDLRRPKVMGTGIVGLPVAAFGFVISMPIGIGMGLAALETALAGPARPSAQPCRRGHGSMCPPPAHQPRLCAHLEQCRQKRLPSMKAVACAATVCSCSCPRSSFLLSSGIPNPVMRERLP